MDKDLNDAVLAAFRRSVGDEEKEAPTPEAEDAPEAEEESSEETDSPEKENEDEGDDVAAGEDEDVPVAVAAPTNKKASSTHAMNRMKGMKSSVGAGRPDAHSSSKGKKKPVPGARGISGNKSAGGEKSPEKTGASPIPSRAVSSHASGETAPSKLPVVLLVLNIVLLLFVAVLMVMVNKLSTAVGDQQSTVAEMEKVIRAADLVKVSKLVRVKGGVYHDPKSRPQTVMFVCDEEDGKLKIKQTIVRPLE